MADIVTNDATINNTTTNDKTPWYHDEKHHAVDDTTTNDATTNGKPWYHDMTYQGTIDGAHTVWLYLRGHVDATPADVEFALRRKNYVEAVWLAMNQPCSERCIRAFEKSHKKTPFSSARWLYICAELSVFHTHEPEMIVPHSHPCNDVRIGRKFLKLVDESCATFATHGLWGISMHGLLTGTNMVTDAMKRRGLTFGPAVFIRAMENNASCKNLDKLVEFGCPVDNDDGVTTGTLFLTAANMSNLQYVKWAHNRGFRPEHIECPEQYDDVVVVHMLVHGYIEPSLEMLDKFSDKTVGWWLMALRQVAL